MSMCTTVSFTTLSCMSLHNGKGKDFVSSLLALSSETDAWNRTGARILVEQVTTHFLDTVLLFKEQMQCLSSLCQSACNTL